MYDTHEKKTTIEILYRNVLKLIANFIILISLSFMLNNKLEMPV